MEDELENYGGNEVEETHIHVVSETQVTDDIC